MTKILEQHIEEDGIHPGHSGAMVYCAADGSLCVDVNFSEDDAWLSQKMLAVMFGVTVPTINEHLKNIFASGEVIANATIREFLIVQNEGSRN